MCSKWILTANWQFWQVNFDIYKFPALFMYDLNFSSSLPFTVTELFRFQCVSLEAV